MKTARYLILLSLWFAGCNRPPAPASSVLPVDQPTNTPPVAVETPVAQAAALKAQGKLTDARALLHPLVGTPDATDKLLALLGEINIQLALTPAAAPEKVDHTIVAGDSLGKLAKQFGVTMELIKKSNGLTGDKIRVGDRLRIYPGKFTVEVGKTANMLTVTDSGKFFKRYRVGTGQFSKTPVGEFKVTSRIENPPWYRTDGKVVPFGAPENILGTHWLGLDVPGYGIHGTWETNSIGKQSSAGCVRLLNDDVAELYILLPLGTPVTIHD